MFNIIIIASTFQIKSLKAIYGEKKLSIIRYINESKCWKVCWWLIMHDNMPTNALANTLHDYISTGPLLSLLSISFPVYAILFELYLIHELRTWLKNGTKLSDWKQVKNCAYIHMLQQQRTSLQVIFLYTSLHWQSLKDHQIIILSKLIIKAYKIYIYNHWKSY